MNLRRTLPVIGLAAAVLFGVGLWAANRARDDAGRALDGATFESVAQTIPARDASGNDVFGRESITFRDGRFDAFHGDYNTTGTYEAEGLELRGYEDSGHPVTGRYDPATGGLMWGGQTYRRKP